jgi:hypothetical protein
MIILATNPEFLGKLATNSTKFKTWRWQLVAILCNLNYGQLSHQIIQIEMETGLQNLNITME